MTDASFIAVQVQAVLTLAEAAGKPLVVDEFNIQRPINQRNQGLQLIYGLLQNASSSVAGIAKPSLSKQFCCSCQQSLVTASMS